MRINKRIRAKKVLCIAENGDQLGVISLIQARKKASEKNLDLVEVAPNANPPVCRIMDYGKYKYKQAKKKKNSTKKSSKTKVKEIKFHVNVGEHDYQRKLRNACKFIDKGHRVKGSLFFRGRENAHRELGFDVMNRFCEELKDFGDVEQKPKLVGRRIFCMVVPQKKH